MSTTENLYGKMQLKIASLAASVSEIVENFRQLREPIIESRDCVPQATKQIDRISQQTEAAASRMLDRVEGISRREEEMLHGLDALKKQLRQNDTAGAETLIDELYAKAKESGNDAFTIIEALQFQDITAQQMDHAASMLEDLGSRLCEILALFPEGVADGQNQPSPGEQRKERVFDPHADMSDKRALQADIDDMFARNK